MVFTKMDLAEVCEFDRSKAGQNVHTIRTRNSHLGHISKARSLGGRVVPCVVLPCAGPRPQQVSGRYAGRRDSLCCLAIPGRVDSTYEVNGMHMGWWISAAYEKKSVSYVPGLRIAE
jgi:hypothetical protein